MKKIKYIKIGTKKNISVKITDKLIRKFSNLSGDKNPIHLKDSHKKFVKKPIAHGFLTASFISNLIGNKFPGPGSLWVSQNLNFIKPVYVNDKIDVLVEVLSLDYRFNIINMKTTIFNNNEIVVDGNAKVKILNTILKENVKVKRQNKIIKKNIIKKDNKKVAIILGSTGKIGREVIKQMNNKNFNLILHYFNNKKEANIILKKLKNYKNTKNILHTCDLEDFNMVKKFINSIIKKYNRIDVVINCASSNINHIKFDNLKWSDFQSQLNSNLKINYNILSLLSSKNLKQKCNFIALNSSFLDEPINNFHHYVAAKGALSALMKSLSKVLVNKNIYINSIAPSQLEENFQMNDLSDRQKMITIAKTPVKRLCSAMDVALAIKYLVSDDASFICGETIRVNGGQIVI